MWGSSGPTVISRSKPPLSAPIGRAKGRSDGGSALLKSLAAAPGCANPTVYWDSLESVSSWCITCSQYFSNSA
ncbi:Uncharacterised protein [Mycobacteroides abscessus subsp. abscessus]|nr:Uncharacterised protein [Mycobacteroides abscessus subsp. abscessus]